jgi:hypothetical protein
MQAVHPQTPQLDNRYQAPPSTQAYPLPPPPPFPVGGKIPPGWVYTPANGWIYIPPAQLYSGSHPGYFPVPPPPPTAPGYQAHLAYPSPYSDVPSGSESNSSPLKHYMNDHPSHTMIPQQDEYSPATRQEGFDPREVQAYDRRAQVQQHNQHHTPRAFDPRVPNDLNSHPNPRQQLSPHPVESEYFDDRSPTYAKLPDRSFPAYDAPGQTQSYPKGILRDSSSESSGHGRIVKFRETPDYAYPQQFRREFEETPEPSFCSPPQWKLRKAKAVPQVVPQGEEGGYPSQMGYYPGDGNENDRQDVPDPDISEDHTSPLRGRGQNNDEVPPMLASVHQQLLSSHGVKSGASGKRSGRDLVRNLESLAEIQVEMNEQVS